MSYNLGHNTIIKTNKNTKRYLKNNEILLNNILDKDFQKMMLPLNQMHSIVFLKEYKICDNFITSNTFKTKIISFFCLVIILLTFSYFTLTDDSNYSDRKQLTAIIFDSIDLVFYPITVFILYKQKVCCSNDNIKFILKMQEIENITKFNKNNKMYTVVNWSLGIGLFLYIFVSIIYGIYCNELTVCCYVFVYCINMNSMFCTRIMYLINNHMKIFNSLFSAKFKKSSCNFDIQLKDLLLGYINVLDAFKIFKNTLRVAVRFL